jgi:hypothetical protein
LNELDGGCIVKKSQTARHLITACTNSATYDMRNLKEFWVGS